MKKLTLVVAVTMATLTLAPAANAETPPSVVIIDNMFDAKLIGGNIKELCITSLNTGCNNGKGFDDSPGAALSPITAGTYSLGNWNHGTLMADIVKQVNPEANLIVIRTARMTGRPGFGSVVTGSDRDFERALEWVISNKTTYNISAVSFSMGTHYWAKVTSRVPNPTCPVNESVRADIISLQNLGVPTVIAAGNDRDKVRIDYPACISEAVAISSSNYFGTNVGEATDFNVSKIGNFNSTVIKTTKQWASTGVLSANGPYPQLVANTTSSVTAAFAAYWSKVSNGNFAETYEKIAALTSNKVLNVLN